MQTTAVPRPKFLLFWMGFCAVMIAILLLVPAGTIHSASPTIKLPGPYPYETPVQIAAPPPPVVDSSPLPAPAPFPYRESLPSLSASNDRDSRTANGWHRVTAKAAREAAFKYNGVPGFCEFLAGLPADVSVFDPKLGKSRPLVKGGRVIRKNVAWLRKDKKTAHKQSRTLVSVEELGARNPGI